MLRSKYSISNRVPILAAVSMSLSVLWFQSRDDALSFLTMVPERALGLLVLRENPIPLLAGLKDFEALAIEIDWSELGRRLPEAEAQAIQTLLTEHLTQVWLILHDLEKRDGQTWRPHLSALLAQRPNHQRLVERQIEAFLHRRFGTPPEIQEQDMLRIYRGNEVGQILYQMRLPDLLLISNSTPGWHQMLQRLQGDAEGSLLKSRLFRKNLEHLPMVNSGFYLFLDGPEISPLLPTFSLRIWKTSQGESQSKIHTAQP